ncbi:hypothetical protein YB2330_004759 [Saitoella coloradoensis]
MDPLQSSVKRRLRTNWVQPVTRERRLGHYERYSLARTSAGFAPIIVILAVVSSQTSIDNLKSRIYLLLSAFPLLRSRISGIKTREPCFQPGDVEVEDILHSEESIASENEIMSREMAIGAKFNVEKGPLWRVGVYKPSQWGGAHYVAATFSHCVTDALGAVTAMKLLLSDTEIEGAEGLPPSLEATIDVRPSVSKLVRVIASDIIAPKIPSFLRPTSKAWPTQVHAQPHHCRIDLKSLHFSLDILTSLRQVSKQHNVSIHTIFHTIAVASLRWASSSPDITTETPISLRGADGSLAHPPTTGNYVCTQRTTWTRLYESTIFWDLAKKYQEKLKNPWEREEAVSGMGMLGYIPDPDPENLPLTGWEEFLLDKAASRSPFAASFELSNLGAVDPLPGVERLWFAQSANPVGSALNVNVVGSKGDGGLGVTVTWRSGAFGGDEIVDGFLDVFQRGLERVAEGRVEEGSTLRKIWPRD